MVQSVFVERAKINSDLLAEELRAMLPLVYLSLKSGNGTVLARLDDNASNAELNEAAQIIIDHDETLLTSKQQAISDGDTAKGNLAAIIAGRIIWHEANPADAGNAVEVLQRFQVEWVYFMKMLRGDIE